VPDGPGSRIEPAEPGNLELVLTQPGIPLILENDVVGIRSFGASPLVVDIPESLDI
jgi:hypothetical protein